MARDTTTGRIMRDCAKRFYRTDKTNRRRARHISRARRAARIDPLRRHLGPRDGGATRRVESQSGRASRRKSELKGVFAEPMVLSARLARRGRARARFAEREHHGLRQTITCRTECIRRSRGRARVKLIGRSGAMLAEASTPRERSSRIRDAGGRLRTRKCRCASSIRLLTGRHDSPRPIAYHAESPQKSFTGDRAKS